MSLEILGIGTATPEHSIEQLDAADLAQTLCWQSSGQLRVLQALHRRTGVRTRHSVLLESSTNSTPARQSFFQPAKSADDRGPTMASRMQRYESDAAPLACAAATAALQDALLSPADVTHLVTASCSGFAAPGFDIALIRDLGFSSDVARTHIGFMGCHGSLNGLRVARAFTDADPNACVLVCAVELCSLHHQYGWDPDKIVTNALFADGAAAVVGRRAGAASSSWRLAASGSTIIADTEDSMSWRIGDHGFFMTLSPQVPDTIRRHLPEWLGGWLGGHNLSVEEIGSWAIHPGGPRVLTACADALGFDPGCLDPSREILAEFGNMSSPTVLFIVERLRERNAARPCVMLGFGPGLAIEAALIR